VLRHGIEIASYRRTFAALAEMIKSSLP